MSVGPAGFAFAAEVKAVVSKPHPCASGAAVCGEATVAGFNEAEYAFYLTSLGASGDECIGPSGHTYLAGTYTASTTFTLDDGSRIALSESGTVCGPGASLTAPGGLVSFGNPVEAHGRWRIEEATGQFAGMSGGGESTFTSAGAVFRASYSAAVIVVRAGALEPQPSDP